MTSENPDPPTLADVLAALERLTASVDALHESYKAAHGAPVVVNNCVTTSLTDDEFKERIRDGVQRGREAAMNVTRAIELYNQVLDEEGLVR